MKNTWTNKWKKVLIWFSAYMSFIAFALVGGYAIVKPESEDVKKTAKTTLIVSIIFAALSAFLSLFYNIGSIGDNYLKTNAYNFYDVCSTLVNIAKIIVFAVFIVLELVKKEKVETKEETATTSEK